MGTVDVLFLLIFLFLVPILFASDECQISMCGNGSIPIRFPFQLEDQTNPRSCGYPGFDLTCRSENKTVLKLPFSEEFYVRQISYITQEILLYDPLKCLPNRLLSLNLLGSPFVSAFYQNFTFLMCPSSFTKSRFPSIDCLSNSTHSVLATSSISLAASMSASCEVIKRLQVPVSRPVQFGEGFSTTLNNDLHLTWFEPDCSNCELQGGMCGFKSNTSQEIGCFYFPGKGKKIFLSETWFCHLQIHASLNSPWRSNGYFLTRSESSNKLHLLSEVNNIIKSCVTYESCISINQMEYGIYTCI